MNKELDNFYSILQKRYSVRKYSTKPVPKEVLDRILAVGHEAASAANRQPWAFIICEGESKKALDEVFYRDGFKDAPVAIAALSKPDEAWERRQDGSNYACVDVTIAVTEMILAATAEGLGTCWIAAFDLDKAKDILDVPDNMDIVTLFTLGFLPDGEKQPERNRKPIEDIIFKGKYKGR